ncbi:uncharacterized protein mRpL48 [Fopius arisanus]|uniref:Uncharacterized protein mRpL48 n=1 Tax=Fopius arisanus TaxID=64838 RepID=A0A9R1U658_9HYME|nr:PREDICTED: uncharacterized protein LOC105270892 [Fopius arisanus]
MAGCVLKKVVGARGVVSGIISRGYSHLWTPDYLDAMKPKIPQHPILNIKMRGYDFPILENYQKLAHIIAVNMDFEIDNSFAVPSKDLKVLKLKSQSTVAEAEYILHVYERNIVISDISAPRLSIYTRMLEAALPQGVTLDIDEWDPDKEEGRYIPDKQLLELKTELEHIQQPKK